MRQGYLSLALLLPTLALAEPQVKVVGDKPERHGFPSMVGAGVNIETLTNTPSEQSSYVYVDQAYKCDELLRVMVGDAEVWTKVTCYDLGNGLFMYREDELDRCGLTATSGNHTPFELKYLSMCTETVIEPLRQDHSLTGIEVLTRSGITLDLDKIRMSNR